jgi:uncharacterized protein with HEPN domain
MRKPDQIYLRQMLAAAERILEKTAGLTHAEFDAAEDRRLAVVWLLQDLGKIALRVSPETQDKLTRVPFHDLITMREKLVHPRLEVDDEVLWATASQELEPLARQLRTALGEPA